LQCNAELDSIKKTCNLACYMEGWIKCHVDFAGTYYPAIFPSTVPHASSPANPATSSNPPSAPLAAPVLGNIPQPIALVGPPSPTYTHLPSNQANAALTLSSPLTSDSHWLLWGGLLVFVAVILLLSQKGN
jgi:hypothetical protein